jgi:calcium channel MID1
MLPETFLCLLNAAIALAQAQQQLSLDVISTFTPSNIPNPPVFTLPQSNNLSITIALCSGTSPPQFFVSNSSSTGDVGSGGGFEITINDGYGTWIGPVTDDAILSVEDTGQSSFELAVSEEGASPMTIFMGS